MSPIQAHPGPSGDNTKTQFPTVQAGIFPHLIAYQVAYLVFLGGMDSDLL